MDVIVSHGLRGCVAVAVLAPANGALVGFARRREAGPALTLAVARGFDSAVGRAGVRLVFWGVREGVWDSLCVEGVRGGEALSPMGVGDVADFQGGVVGAMLRYPTFGWHSPACKRGGRPGTVWQLGGEVSA